MADVKLYQTQLTDLVVLYLIHYYTVIILNDIDIFVFSFCLPKTPAAQSNGVPNYRQRPLFGTATPRACSVAKRKSLSCRRRLDARSPSFHE